MVVVLLWVLFIPLIATAQTNSAVVKGKSKNLFTIVRNLVVGYLDYYDYDTTYIHPPKFYYTLMMQESANFELYTLRSLGEKRQVLRFAPDHSHRLGAYFGWHGLFLGASVNADELFSKRKPSNKKAEYFFNLYGNKVGADFFYRSTGNDFKIRHTDGFFDKYKEKDFNGTDFSGLKVRSMGFNVYYVFNHKHFSYPAAYSQTTVQKISRGTLVAGISWSRHHLDFNHQLLPDEIRVGLSDDLKFKQVKYTDFNINCGYAFNWVFADNWLLAVAFTPAVAYKASHITTERSTYNQESHNINLDFITRAGLVYNNNRFFAGASAVTHIYQYYQRNFSLTDNFGIFNFYTGFNFGKRKQP
jgi:hypothetical protein